MNVLNKFAYLQQRKDDVPNQILAKELAEKKDTKSIEIIAENLWNPDKNIQSDCIKVLYEIGYINPELIADYVLDFLKLLEGKNNRLIWGGMIALSTIAKIKHKKIFENIEIIINAIKNGSVITCDYGIKTMAILSSIKESYNKKLFPILINYLKNCRPKDVVQYAEKISMAVNSENKEEFIKILKIRKSDLKKSQLKRLEKILKKL